MPWVILLSRVLMAAIFIQSGFGKATNPSHTMAMMASHNLPLPGLAYAVSVLVELGGGLAFLVGWNGRAAALVLSIWCVATAFVAHYHPGDTNNMIHFMKNLCMAGGFLQVVVYGSGAFSIDRR
jgi:putative oxidoreductase